MKIAVWKTGHEIADTVANSVNAALPDSCIATMKDGSWPKADAHIAYGILRGTSEVFKKCNDVLGKPWFNIDRGYFRPGHYEGYYRISLRGTQQTIGLDKLEPDYERLEALKLDIKPWRSFDHSKPVLVCPPTYEVAEFYGLKIHKDRLIATDWELEVTQSIMKQGRAVQVRHKGEQAPINFNTYNYVVTFNSSVGWQALMAGIPCVSDPKHSIVGSWFKDVSIDDLSFSQHNGRMELFAAMSSLQLTLDEMRAGKAWEVVSSLLSISGSMPVNPQLPTFAPIAFQSVQNLTFTSNT